MEDNTLLTFKSTATYTDTGESDTIEFLTNARLYEKNEKTYVSFAYPDSFGEKGSKATLKIEGKKVTLLKYGESCTQFIFEENTHHNGHYETPYGSLSVGIFSDFTDIKLQGKSGDINLQYSIYFNDLKVNNTKLHINLKEKKI